MGKSITPPTSAFSVCPFSLCVVLRYSRRAVTGRHILRRLLLAPRFSTISARGRGIPSPHIYWRRHLSMGMDPYGGGGDPTPATFWRPRESERGAYTEKKWGDETLAVWELTHLPAGAVVPHVTVIPYRGDRGVVAWKNGVQTLPEEQV